MLIAYYSKTKNIKRFVSKIQDEGFRFVDITVTPKVDEDFVLITPTHKYGEVPVEVESFLGENSSHLIAVSSSGNKLWGADLFARSGDLISKKYNVPLLHKFQNHGFKEDVDIFIKGVLNLGQVDFSEQ